MSAKPTASANQARIIRLEDDVDSLDERVLALEKNVNEVLVRLDTIIRMARLLVGMVAAGLGLDMGIEGGVI
tara:strand:- start:368 stop:583 length:216 start_codon:yes stop_codon:yes gene_type:complete